MNKAEESAIIEYIKEKPEFLESLSEAIKDICSYMEQILSDEKFMEELKKSENKQDTAEWIERDVKLVSIPTFFSRDGQYTQNIYKCSNCEFEVYKKEQRYNYCPNCGAKMKGESE